MINFCLDSSLDFWPVLAQNQTLSFLARVLVDRIKWVNHSNSHQQKKSKISWVLVTRVNCSKIHSRRILIKINNQSVDNSRNNKINLIMIIGKQGDNTHYFFTFDFLFKNVIIILKIFFSEIKIPETPQTLPHKQVKRDFLLNSDA